MNSKITGNPRVWVMAFIAVVGALVFCLLPPLAQPESYHHFADDRTFLGIPNFWNVISNAPFAVVGVMGLAYLGADFLRKGDSFGMAGIAALDFLSSRKGFGQEFLDHREKLPYMVFFTGALLTCFGSSYYHWSPNDATLTWDRLPMTLAFMGLLSAIITERVDVGLGLLLLWPLVIAGAGTVWWWRHTGNLWPYAGAQYFPIVLIGLMMALFPPRYTRSVDLIWVTGFYVLAKIFEAADVPVFRLTQGMISGHTIKHLVAALAVYWVLRMLYRRRPCVPVMEKQG